MSYENRNRLRVKFHDLAFTTGGDDIRTGVIDNLSSGGAKLKFTSTSSELYHSFIIGDSLTLIVDHMSALKGTVVWVGPREIALSFKVSSQDEERLIAEIMEVESKMLKDASVGD